MSAVDVSHLTVNYRGASAPAVDDMSFTVERGEVFGFLGPSGAGKSTVHRVLREQGALTLWAVSPLGTGSYLAYRAVTAGGLTALGLAVALPLSGLADGDPWSVAPAVPAAVLLAPALVLGLVAAASDRVRALVLLKVVGAVFVLVPVAVWVLPPPWAWVLLPLPVVWPLAALPAYGLAPPPLGTLCSTVAGGALVLAAWRWARAALER